MEEKKKGWLNGFVIATFVILYALTSSISMIHIVDFFNLSNSETMSWVLSIAFEVGAAASLAALTILDKLKRNLVIGIFVLLTALQAMGNVYYSFTNLTMTEIKDWIDLFGLSLMDPIAQRRIISIVSGLPLPIIALGFIKSLVDYLKPAGHHTVFDEKSEEENQQATMEDLDQRLENLAEQAQEQKEKEAEENVEKAVDAVSDAVQEKDQILTKEDVLKSISREDLISIINQEDEETEGVYTGTKELMQEVEEEEGELVTDKPIQKFTEDELITDVSKEPLEKVETIERTIEFDPNKEVDIMKQVAEMQKQEAEDYEDELVKQTPTSEEPEEEFEPELLKKEDDGYDDEDYVENESPRIARAPQNINISELDNEVFDDIQEVIHSKKVSLSELNKEREKNFKEFEQEKRKRFDEKESKLDPNQKTPRINN